VTFVCAVCAHREAFEVVSYPSYPAFLPPLPRELARDVVRAPLTLVACCACGHFQIPHVDAEVQRMLYEVYYRHYEVDTMETMIPAYREPFNKLVESLDLPHGRLLEIGCSSGAMVPFLTRFCREYTGVDPSERIELARERYPSHTFIRSYFPSHAVQGPFDVAVSQFNLEHIEKAGEFIAALAAAVREGGMLLLQVPDAGYFIRTQQPNFVAHEHVHYFRREQLELLLGLHGFTVEHWGAEGASIIAAARRVGQVFQPAPQAQVRKPALHDALELRDLTSHVPDLPKRPILYGVGLTLHWLLAKNPAMAHGAVVVDDNPGYQGKGVPGYDLPIEAPSRELLDGRDVVLTLNAIYHDRVIERIGRMGATVRVHRIGGA
jgi:2-polyprenyl-3-methyl-5-hydroxy-6-metoxy-1,4-benzoquinol methylase